VLTLIPFLKEKKAASWVDDGLLESLLTSLSGLKTKEVAVGTNLPHVAAWAKRHRFTVLAIPEVLDENDGLTPAGSTSMVRDLLECHGGETKTLLLDPRRPLPLQNAIKRALSLFDCHRAAAVISIKKSKLHPSRLNWHLKTILAGAIQATNNLASLDGDTHLVGSIISIVQRAGADPGRIHCCRAAVGPNPNDVQAVAVCTCEGTEILFPRLSSVEHPGLVLSCLAVHGRHPEKWEETIAPLKETRNGIPIFQLPRQFFEADMIVFCLLEECVHGEYHLQIPFEPAWEIWRTDPAFGRHRAAGSNREIRGRQDVPVTYETDGRLIIASLQNLLHLSKLFEEGKVMGVLLEDQTIPTTAVVQETSVKNLRCTPEPAMR